MLQPVARLPLLLMLAFALFGCNGFGGSSNLFVPIPGNPGDAGEEVVGGGPLTLRGTVVFADTNLGLRSDVTFADRSVSPTDGNFAIDIPHGTHAYVIETLMGRHSGTVVHDGQGEKRLRFPAFDGWSNSYFNDLLIGVYGSHTIRWPRRATIPVWIQSPQANANVTPRAMEMAWSAFQEWQRVVDNTITFERQNTRAAAEDDGIIVSFDTKANVANKVPNGHNARVIGVCEVWYRLQPGRGEIVRGEISLAYDYQDSPALHRHEIGHCIGLSHSSDPTDVMHSILTDNDKPLSLREQRITQLLYSIPLGTSAFREYPAAMRFPAAYDLVHIDEPDGTVRRIIPAYTSGPGRDAAQRRSAVQR